VICMRTTLDLDDGLVTRAKLLAVRRKTTLTALIEQSLARTLADLEEAAGAVDLPVSESAEAPADFPWGSGGAMLEYLEARGAAS